MFFPPRLLPAIELRHLFLPWSFLCKTLPVIRCVEKGFLDVLPLVMLDL